MGTTLNKNAYNVHKYVVLNELGLVSLNVFTAYDPNPAYAHTSDSSSPEASIGTESTD